MARSGTGLGADGAGACGTVWPGDVDAGGEACGAAGAAPPAPPAPDAAVPPSDPRERAGRERSVADPCGTVGGGVVVGAAEVGAPSAPPNAARASAISSTATSNSATSATSRRRR